LQYQQNNGPGLTGWSIANAAPATNYFGYGGTHRAPDGAYEATGVWLRTMNLQAGEQAVFAINCNMHGCNNWNSGYNLFELQSDAGADVIGYSPKSSTLSMDMRGAPYSFTQQAFTAGTINVGTLNATTINGSISGANISSGTIAASFLPLFRPSGTAHASGIVPDPGAIAGSTRFLREDGTWSVPGTRASTITLEHVFTGAGTFNYTHNLGTLYPLRTCYVNSGSATYSASNPDANDIAITVPAAADITCTFGI
jgi:hypothetical protein